MTEHTKSAYDIIMYGRVYLRTVCEMGQVGRGTSDCHFLLAILLELANKSLSKKYVSFLRREAEQE